MLTLLKAIVVASMEYACVVWSPTKQRDIDLLENVQRRFTSRFGCFLEYNIALGTMQCTVNYPERLQRLNIFSLQRRRERYLIIYMYKIIIGIVPNPGLRLDGLHVRTNTRRMFPKYNRHAATWICNARCSSVE